MHPYSIDTNARQTVYSLLAIIAFVIPGFVASDRVTHLVGDKLSYPFGVGATFGVLFLLFDHVFWKWLQFILHIPNLNGTWTAKGISSYEDPATGKPMEFVMEYKIKQTFTRIEISGETDKSTSRSTMASLEIDHAVPIFRYAFENTPRNMSDAELQRHPGLIELRLNSVAKMTGDYFSGKHRLRYGELIFTKA
ncbi:hypothetical protein GCM10023213_08020 [Prosthecobacter algae]|uniref:CD-NTase-associated protein 15 domain-containing protein n=1 Tax=Prosthecobacter algae TaxID=1144682 RepID=A0ABP9NVJ3_9BACT